MVTVKDRNTGDHFDGRRFRGVNINRQNQEVGQAFEPRRGSTLLEQLPDFAGKFKKQSDAVALSFYRFLSILKLSFE